MERHQLEDRIRASLQARAEDVAPTPELWERVSERTTRRARWTLGLWALSGVAAVVLVVFGGMALLDTPRHIEIQPEPDVVAPTDSLPVPVDPSIPTVVTTDGEKLFEVDPDTGEVRREMAPYEGFVEAGEAVEVAVRPLDDPGRLTVATVVEREGMFDIEVTDFDADGQRVDRQPIGMAAPASGSTLPPDIVWSADGRYLMWAGTSFAAGEISGPSLWAYDWVERPANDDGEALPFRVTAPGADGALFAGDGTVDLRTWTGTPVGRSTVLATTVAGGAFRIDLNGDRDDCADSEPCPPTFEADIADLGFEGVSPMDLGVLGNDVHLALVVPTAGQGGPDGDAESATLQLVAEPMSDAQRVLDMPQLTDGTAGPLDAWMAAAGDRVAVGMGPEARLLTVTGGTVEELEVTDAVRLPDGTRAADMATFMEPGQAPDADATADTSEPTDTTSPAEAIDDDGVPTHVITGGPDQLQLVERRSPDQPLVTMGRPAGTDHEMAPGEVVVHPDSTADDLQLVTTWVIGESQVLARTVVRDGEVVANEVLADEAQPRNTGGAAETAHSVPVFSPDGRWLAWVETPDGGAGPAQVRIVEWVDGQAEGPGRAVTAPADAAQPFLLLDWARTSEGDVLTMAPSVGPGPDARASATMIELGLQVTGEVIAESTDDDWRFVDLPGALFDVGSYAFEEGTQRYIVFDGGDEVMYALAESPDTAVETGALPFSEGQVVTFGPDSALVQRPDGAWQRVQVDTGAASPVEVPEGTRALLPWRG